MDIDLYSSSPRKKIILAFVISSVLGASIVGVFLQFRLLNTALEQWRINNRFLVHTLTEYIQQDIQTGIEILAFASEQPAFRSLPFIDEVDRSINGLPENVDLEKRRILEMLRAGVQRFSILFVLSPNGDHYISHPYMVQKNLKKFNLADRAYFVEATKSKKPVVSDSFIGADGVPAVAINIPILNPENDIVAHLGGVYHLSKLSELIEADAIRPFDKAFILDQKEFLIAHTNKILLEGGTHVSFSNHQLINDRASDAANTENRKTDKFTDPETGTKYLVESSTLDFGWSLFLLRNEASVIDDVQSQIITISLLTFFLFIVIGSGGVIVTANITRKWEKADYQISQLAMTDQLTGLANRRAFNQRLRKSIKLAEREDSFLALMSLDLDKFKPVNDTYGHPIGDSVLQSVSSILNKHTRITDIVARTGGDEFEILVIHPKGKAGVSQSAQRIIDEIKKPMQIEGHTINIGVSIGIAFYPEDAENEEELIKKADLTLYDVKESGRGSFRFYGSGLN